jgi:preprotein translocase subunit YajC
MALKTNLLLSSLALVALAGAAPSLAQAPAAAATAGFTVGTKVIDTAGGEVGTVTSVTGDNVIVKTDKHDVTLPKASFTATDKGLLFALTQAQLNAKVEEVLAEPLLSVGATVYDTQGGIVGTVKEFDDTLATLTLPHMQVQLPVSAFVHGPNGPVIGDTAASLEAKAAAATAAATPTPVPAPAQ